MRLVVPFGPDGSTDILARLVAQNPTEALSRQVIVDNRPSAGSYHGMSFSEHLLFDRLQALAIEPRRSWFQLSIAKRL
jgi:hypothetical protein